MTSVQLSQGTRILIDGVETTLEALSADGNVKYEWVANSDENSVLGQVVTTQHGEAGETGEVLQISEQQNIDDDADRLTDSNSSDKMSPLHEEECINEPEDASAVPLNFPIKGKILARLQGRGFEYYMTKPKIVIGRDSSKGTVDINMGHSNFISRNHLTIVHDGGEFYLSCGGKNGVFVDNEFQKIGAPRMKIPKSCALRFPSTQIVIAFDAAECFIEEYSTTTKKTLSKFTFTTQPVDKQLTALRVQIPPNGKQDVTKKPQFFSPCPSPTGTMSAVNSCPTSPNGAGNVPVFTRKAVVGSSSHKYVSTPESLSVKDSRIPVPLTDETKPPYSYAQLIVQAISSTPQKQMTLSGIYAYISRNYCYYRANDKGWQNSIRHNLSLNRYFIKVARSQEEPGKGCFWAIDPVSEPKLVAQAFRRRNKRGVPYFRGAPSNAIVNSKSCPASPTRTPINITIVTPDQLFASPVTSAAAVGFTSVDTASVLTTSSAAQEQPSVQSTVLANTANLSNANNNNIVTIATSSSLAEAITMQQSKGMSHVLDMSGVRAIQSAPGSPLQGYKVLSQLGSQQGSLLTAKVLGKGNTAGGITLLQPFSGLTSLATTAGKPRGSIVTLASPQGQLLRTGSLLTPVQAIPMASTAMTSLPVTSLPVTSIPVTSLPMTSLPVTSLPMTSIPAPTLADNIQVSESVETNNTMTEVLVRTDPFPLDTQPRVQPVPVNQQPIRFIQLKRPAEEVIVESINPSPAKMPRSTSS